MLEVSSLHMFLDYSNGQWNCSGSVAFIFHFIKKYKLIKKNVLLISTIKSLTMT